MYFVDLVVVISVSCREIMVGGVLELFSRFLMLGRAVFNVATFLEMKVVFCWLVFGVCGFGECSYWLVDEYRLVWFQNI